MRKLLKANMSTSEESTDKGQNVDESKQPDDAIPEKVHSANSWETADLGDDDRKKKFLRLMGAAKSEHQGRFIIGEKSLPAHKHTRDQKETEEIQHELEEQYKHTFEHRITKWSHKGLGFDDEKRDEPRDETTTTTSSNQSGDSKEDSKPDPEKSSEKDSQTVDQSVKKRESTEPVQNPEVPPKKPKMMMSFVKASDS